jgi:transcriptional regulator with XRE-family HTH domain
MSKTKAPAQVVYRVGERVIRYREAKGWTRYRLSKESGLSHQLLAQIEGGGLPSWPTACKLADTLGVSLDQLRG